MTTIENIKKEINLSAKSYLDGIDERNRMYDDDNNDGAFELECELRDIGCDLAEYIKDSTKDKELTKIIRLNWCATFEDFTISESASKEDIQYCINVALRCREDECEKFKTMMNKKGYFCEYHRPIIEQYDFNISC